jgi:hypothetical protein
MAASPTTAITFQNFYTATLTSDITSSATDIFLDTVPNGTEGFLVIDPDSTTGREVIYYNAKSATKVTCPSAVDGRGQDDTTAGAHLTGTTVIMAPVAAYFETLLALFTTSPQGWTSLSGTFTSPGYAGNRSQTVSTSVDQTSILSPGMRVRTTRTVAAPTQCTSLNGTTQYYSKSSPAGMTFTDDFYVSAWVKMTSYTNQIIASRYNGTSGWQFRIDGNGAVNLQGFNAASGNYSVVTSYQSIPLNKWVHVAAQLDMSAFAITADGGATGSYTMIDGQNVPANVSRAGTNPTALIQAGNLEIGGTNGGTLPFQGKIAQVAIFSTKIAQATIQGFFITHSFAGNESSLVSAYSFNNTINDLNTTNANNLTAQGSAVATNADSPFGGNGNGTISSTLDYGIITKVTASTLTIQMAEGCTIPTSGGVSAMSYSTYKAPYLFPAQRGKWTVGSIINFQTTQAAAVAGTWYNVGSHQLTIPVGEWQGTYMNSPLVNATTSGVLYTTLSTGAATETNIEFTTESYYNGTAIVGAPRFRSRPISLSAATLHYLNLKQTNGTGVTIYNYESSNSVAIIEAELAHL